MDSLGVIHGRFQVLHNGHIEYLLEGKRRCKHLIVGICNPSPTQTNYDSANPHRSFAVSNPFTYYERFVMLKEALIESNVRREEFDIVPFPISFPDEIYHYVPLDAVFYMTIYDAWGEKKFDVLRKMGLQVDVMWRRDIAQKLTSGSEIRSLINDNREWAHLVPKSVYNYILENHLDTRIKKFFTQAG